MEEKTKEELGIFSQIHDVYNIIESMCSVYDLEKTTLKEFVRDVKHAHALQLYLSNHYYQSKN